MSELDEEMVAFHRAEAFTAGYAAGRRGAAADIREWRKTWPTVPAFTQLDAYSGTPYTAARWNSVPDVLADLAEGPSDG
jgi:hypothetical protein